MARTGKRVRLCPEITDPNLRMFLDIVPQVRRFNREASLAVPLRGEAMQVPLEGREVPVCLHRAAPAPDGAALPVVFELHGGGFVFGLAEKDDALCERLREGIGCHVVGISYRLSPETPYPGALDDVCGVIAYFQERAARYGMDPARMAVIGFSAGATLATGAAMRALHGGGFSLCAQVLHYPFLDSSRMPDEKVHYDCDMDPIVMEAFTRLYAREEERTLPEVSPVCADPDTLRGMVPTLIVPAERDSLREEGLRYAELLRAAGVETECQVVPGTHHGYIEDACNPKVYEELTAPPVKATHSPYFRVWAEAGLGLSCVFLRRQFGMDA